MDPPRPSIGPPSAQGVSPGAGTSPSPPISLGAEAAALFAVPECDGSDSHLLGVSGRYALMLALAGAGLLVIELALHIDARSLVFPIALLIAAAISYGRRMRVERDAVVVESFGRSRLTPLGSVHRVERRVYRGQVSLRLWTAGDDRPLSVPIRGRGFAIDSAAAAHLLRCLDRSDVAWEPGAWETLRTRAPLSAAPSAPSAPHADSSAPSRSPQGVRVVARPRTRGQKLLAGLLLLVVAGTSVMFVVLVPVQWSGYAESQTIQSGPEALATLQSESVSASSSRYGTVHTSHFQVEFVTTAGTIVDTTVNAPGRYEDTLPGTRFLIRYDPGDPGRAELPGHPDHTLRGSLLLTFAGLVYGCFAFRFLRVFWRRRRRARAGGPPVDAPAPPPAPSPPAALPAAPRDTSRSVPPPGARG